MNFGLTDEEPAMRRFAWVGALVLGMGYSGIPRAEAFVTRPTSLSNILAEHQFIFTAKVDVLDPSRPSVVLVVDADLKGKAPFRRLPVNLTGDRAAEKEKHTPQLLRRLAPNLPLVLFVNQAGEKGDRFPAFAYTNGTW